MEREAEGRERYRLGERGERERGTWREREREREAWRGREREKERGGGEIDLEGRGRGRERLRERGEREREAWRGRERERRERLRERCVDVYCGEGHGVRAQADRPTNR